MARLDTRPHRPRDELNAAPWNPWRCESLGSERESPSRLVVVSERRQTLTLWTWPHVLPDGTRL
jgi:hypothetical protein